MDVIGDIIKREGPPTNDSIDKGGRTIYGISEAFNPAAWADGVVTLDEARVIYENKYVKWPGWDKVPTQLQPQLIDWGVTSGPQLVIGILQQLVGVKVDYVIGPITLAAIQKVDSRQLNNQLVAARVRMIGRIVSKDLSQSKYLNGWLNRALEFIG